MHGLLLAIAVTCPPCPCTTPQPKLLKCIRTDDYSITIWWHINKCRGYNNKNHPLLSHSPIRPGTIYTVVYCVHASYTGMECVCMRGIRTKHLKLLFTPEMPQTSLITTLCVCPFQASRYMALHSIGGNSTCICSPPQRGSRW